MRQAVSILLTVALVALAATAAQAQVSNVFNMPSGQTSLLFVPVGEPGNLPDPVDRFTVWLGRVRLSDGRV